MCGDRLEALARLDVPDAHALVKRARDDEIGLGVVVYAKHIVCVAGERLDALARGHVPHLDRLVVRAGAEVL